ncbi:MAG: 30S ribosomal protein S6 [Caldilineaceae bacterium]|nr:30S ribosomal protein S6 [Caldilineaceae bacterium]
MSSELELLEEQREYELVYVLQGSLDDDGVRDFNERLNQVIETQSGSVTTTEIWGRRTLAYPIGKNFEGHYILERFQMPPAGTAELDRLLRFNENVMRYLLIRSGE